MEAFASAVFFCPEYAAPQSVSINVATANTIRRRFTSTLPPFSRFAMNASLQQGIVPPSVEIGIDARMH
jgi:uncharacterized membrane protein